MVVNATEFEIIEFLDFDFEATCESVNGCDNPVSWSITIGCCKTVFLMCNDCTVLVRKWETPGFTFTCGACSTASSTPVGHVFVKL